LDWLVVPVPRLALAAFGALVLTAGCTETAATGGAVPIDRGTDPAGGLPGTTAAGTPPTTADASKVVAAVNAVLGGQAAISRPLTDQSDGVAVEDDRVFVLGDSITESTDAQHYGTLDRQLRPLGWAVTIDAKRGRTTQQGIDELDKHGDEVHDAAVVLLGHNDAVDPTAYRKKLDRIVELLSGVRRVVLLTNYEFEPGRDRMNAELWAEAAAHPGVEVVDWNAVVSSTSGAIGPVGLHLTMTGARALAATIAVALGPAPVSAGSS
jgi:lysophospholipase L1-like esterase